MFNKPFQKHLLMKKLFTLILVCFAVSGISQSKLEIGITTEGSFFMPSTTINYAESNKNGFGAGIGVYASHNIFKWLSADIGLTYRYLEMQQHYTIYSGAGGYSDYKDPGSISEQPFVSKSGWDKFPMNYFVIPVCMKFNLMNHLYVSGGIEAAWLTNYNVVNEKPEFNEILGIGSHKHKLNWSVNYIRGIKDQGFGNNSMEADGHYKGAIYRNNMIQLKLSYPIWRLE